MPRLAIACCKIFLLLAIAPPALLAQEVQDPEITYKELMRHIKYLANDLLEGRASGSPGAEVASDYVAEQFEFVGLEPFGDEDTFFQKFTLPRGVEILPSSTVSVEKKKRKTNLAFGKEFTVLANSAAGNVTGQAVFAGYGISAPSYEYDDYEAIDVTGRIVVVLRGVPGEGSKSPFTSRQAVRNFATFKAKQDTAAGLGAVGIIIVNDPADYGPKTKDKLVASGGSSRQPQGSIPCIQMTCRGGTKLFSRTGISLSKIQKRIDKTLFPQSEPVDDCVITINARIEAIKLDVRNVVGILRAAAPDRKKENVVVGAHFDHVGLGEFGSRGGTAARGKVHNGADDNASGTAALIEIAGFLMPLREQLKRDVIFSAFTAEEMGLHGSQHYVSHPPTSLAETAAMVNLDMVGRLKRDDLFIGGVGTSPVFENVIKEANRRSRVKLSLGQGGEAPTDSTSFYKKNVPVLFFFTGLHKDYHLPSDDWKLIDTRGTEKVVKLAAAVTRDLAMLEERPPFARADTGGYRSGPHLGITVTQKTDGLYVSAVEKKSPASRAGFRENDKVLDFEGSQINTAADFYGVKANMPPGKKVDITVRRQGRVRILKPKLGKS